ncbi:MAG: helix-turn-helix domain-containing protein [Victivallales bacterium]|nr:helix-turn-helix domain-containing protein [Victivallales bacterium]
MDCYGNMFDKRSECASCELRRWCRSASDPPRLSDQMADWDKVCEVATPANMITDHPAGIFANDSEEQELYSRDDLLEVIGFLLALDLQTLDMLDAKIANPGVSFSDIARRRGVSRQAVHKYIRKKCDQIPELSIVLQNHSQKRKFSKNFMEEVCRIKKQMSAKKSKKPKEGLRFSKKLICWNRNLDLSKMSIFKGSTITGNAWKV